jgi:Protein of unknown function (DUF1064)
MRINVISVGKRKKLNKRRLSMVLDNPKYFNKPTILGGIRFDSRLEADTYNQIKNSIQILNVQQTITTPTGDQVPKYGYIIFPHCNLSLYDFELSFIPSINYRIDFLIIKIDKLTHKIVDFAFVESKGVCTKDFKIKIKLLLSKIHDFYYSSRWNVINREKWINDGSGNYLTVVTSAKNESYSFLEKMKIKVLPLSGIYPSLIERFSLPNSDYMGNMIPDYFLDDNGQIIQDKIIELRDNFLYQIEL